MESTMRKGRYNVLAVLCIGIGALLILENYGYVKGIYHLWPIFPLILGIGLYMLYVDKGKRNPTILAMGVYIIQFSALAFYANYTTWASMEYLWPFYIGFLGVSFLSVYIGTGKGMIFFHLGVFLIGLCIVFFLVFSIDYRLWPISLVLFGISILLIKEFNRS
jgi:LiaF transmembrane domain